MKALVIGGTGPTGPFLINGLIAQDYDVSMMHRGTHDSDEIPLSVPRIIGDPHFRETLTEALSGRTFDLIIATYGRIRYVAEIAGDHCDNGDNDDNVDYDDHGDHGNHGAQGDHGEITGTIPNPLEPAYIATNTLTIQEMCEMAGIPYVNKYV